MVVLVVVVMEVIYPVPHMYQPVVQVQKLVVLTQAVAVVRLVPVVPVLLL